LGPRGAQAVIGQPEALNAICPYFTMFPLRFPLDVLRGRARAGQWVLDPFCGRGTTAFAARLLGLQTLSADTSPVAVALTEAKLLGPEASPGAIAAEARAILRDPPAADVPTGEFWELAYRHDVLEALCALRAALLDDCTTPARKALRAVLLGALHGPRRVDGGSSYLSNQAPRTFAPKPRYAVGFWRRRGLAPPAVDVLSVIALRAQRYYGAAAPPTERRVAMGDSRDLAFLGQLCADARPAWIVTSPPYYGLRTYVPDQWLRAWFVGGPPAVDYSYGVQLSHRSRQAFVADLRKVWTNIATLATRGATMIVRFGAINDRKLDPRAILEETLTDTPWRLRTIEPAGTAAEGKRQASSFNRMPSRAVAEIDAWAVLG
jgi:hypothetical protein